MKGVYSFWSKPYYASLEKGFAGFNTEQDFRDSFALSLRCLRKSVEKVQLVTDTRGYELLVGRFGFQFDAVSLALNDISDAIPSDMWMFGKLKAYSIQCEPFMHIDFDLYFLKPLSNLYRHASIVTQSVEWFSQYDYPRRMPLLDRLGDLPEFTQVFDGVPMQNRYAYNVGMIGGQYWEAIRDYALAAMQAIESNLFVLRKLTPQEISDSNIVFEQYFLSCYAKYKNLCIVPYIHDLESRVELAHKGFCHLLANNKRNEIHMQGVRNLLKQNSVTDGIIQSMYRKGVSYE